MGTVEAGNRREAMFRIRRTCALCWAAVLVFTVASGALFAVPAFATSAMSWATPTPIDYQPPFANTVSLNGVSCPSASLCVAVDESGDVVASTDPTGGTATWTPTKVAEGFKGVSCPSAQLCIAVGDKVIAASTDPTGGAGTWSTDDVSRDLRSVSCASTSLCVATDGHGDVWTSTNPTGGAGAWSETELVEEELGGVSCPTIKLCVAVDSERGDVWTSTNPTGGAGAWTVTHVDPHKLYDVSCASESLCVATDNSGDVLTSTHPTGGASEWTSAHVGGGLLERVSCAPSGLCVALGDGTEVVTSTEPTSGAGAWTSTPIEAGEVYSLDGVSCPAQNLCVLVDSGSEVVTSTEPTGGVDAWPVTPVAVGHSTLLGVSCASVDLCVWVDDAGNVTTSTDPAGGVDTWVESHVDEHGLNAVSCVPAGLCVAVDRAGDVLTSTDPTGGAAAWTLANVDGTMPLRGVACASVSLCVVIDREGDVISSSNPTGGAGAWRVAEPGEGRLGGVACPSEHVCIATEVNAGNVVVSTNPTGGSAAWSARRVETSELGAISCPSTSLCVAIGPGTVMGWGNPTSGEWSETHFEELNGLSELSCAPGGLCTAMSFGGNGSPGNVITSSDPAGGAATWSESNIYGLSLEPPSPEFSLFEVDMAGVACVSEGMCIAGDDASRVMVGVPASDVAPENISSPALVGTPAVGEALSCINGGWSGQPSPILSDVWLRNGVPIPGATASSYTVQAADAGAALECEVTAANGAGRRSATSNQLQVPAAPREPAGGGPSSNNLPSSGNLASSTYSPPSSLGPPFRLVNSAVVLASLARQLAVSTKVASIGSLLKQGGLRMSVQALEAGTLVVDWWQVPKGARLSRKVKPVLIASGRLIFPAAGSGMVKISLTAAGRKLLAHVKRQALTVQGVFTPNAQDPISATKGIVVRR